MGSEKIKKPGGSYTDFKKGKNFKLKEITVKPGHRLSLQKHNYRSEHWVVIQGIASIILNERCLILSKANPFMCLRELPTG